jgi:hypothetical protein
MSSRGVSLIKLICGQIGVTLLLAVIPGLAILSLFGGVQLPTGLGGILASVHLLLMVLEYACQGQWIPSRGRAVVVLFLPLLDLLALTWLLRIGAWSWALISLGLLVLSATLVRLIVHRWRFPDETDTHSQLPVRHDSSAPLDGADPDLAMMDF